MPFNFTFMFSSFPRYPLGPFSVINSTYHRRVAFPCYFFVFLRHNVIIFNDSSRFVPKETYRVKEFVFLHVFSYRVGIR